ncbi:MAG: hypothetical protein AB1394_08015 [Bacteroidota bacterium]
MKFKLCFLFTLLFVKVFIAQNTFVRIDLSQTKYRLFDPVVIDFSFQPASSNTQYRYKLNVPSDWLGGIKYAANKWTEWQNGSSGHVVYSNFKIEGKYKFFVEFRDANNTRFKSSSLKEFNMYLEYPEIQYAELNIDLNRINAESDINKKYSIAAEEFKKSYLAWYKKYEYQFKLLKLTSEPNSFFNTIASTTVEETAWKAAEEIVKSGSKSVLAKGAVPWLQKVFLSKTIYDIVKEFSVTTILLFRNYEANKALIMEAINYRLWKYFEERAKQVLKENKSENFIVFIEKFFRIKNFKKTE